MDINNLKSGDKFKSKGNKYNPPATTIYTLQKLPDFDLWVLVSDYGVSKPGIRRFNYWCAPQPSAIQAFGHAENEFEKII